MKHSRRGPHEVSRDATLRSGSLWAATLQPFAGNGLHCDPDGLKIPYQGPPEAFPTRRHKWSEVSWKSYISPSLGAVGMDSNY